jgi:hypothetical protein
MPYRYSLGTLSTRYTKYASSYLGREHILRAGMSGIKG